MNDAEKIACLRLIRTENVGSITFKNLLSRYHSASEALLHLPELAHRGGKTRFLSVYSEKQALNEMEQHFKIGAKLVFFNDDDYPEALKQIHDAPPVLSVLGNIDYFKTPCISIVGTRNASVNGRNMARRMANDFVTQGYGVVSGMALGIDAAAHEGALYASEKKAGTIAVLGTGINVPYPQQNKKLYFQIKEKGLLISDFPFDSKPQPSCFPRRNRIISGLSQALVVIEATLKSGSLITANKALEQGRDVMAVPGNPMDARSGGVNHLIKNGAPLVESAQDVLNLLPSSALFSLKEDFSFSSTETFFSDSTLSNSDLSSTDLLEKLGVEPVGTDQIIRETGLPAAIISALLVELELAGRIERLPANRVVRISDYR